MRTRLETLNVPYPHLRGRDFDLTIPLPPSGNRETGVSTDWLFLIRKLSMRAMIPSKEERNEIAVVSGFGVKENAIPSIKPQRVSVIKYPLAKKPCHLSIWEFRRLI
jgi:hypothetical protein